MRLKVGSTELYFCENSLQWIFFPFKTAKKITRILMLYCHMILSQLPRKNTSQKTAYVSSRLVVKFGQVNEKG